MSDVIKRNFKIGEEWLYLKLYMRSFFADKILIKINDFISDKINENKIEKWFFIRYNDPDFHIRLRLFVPDQNEAFRIIGEINNLLSTEINEKIVMITLGHYSREIERYDLYCMEKIEDLFFYDTITVLSVLKNITTGELSETDRWLYGMIAMDKTLTDFQLGDEEKKIFVLNMNHLFSNEFEKDKFLTKQLDKKFRENEMLISDNLNKSNVFSKLINQRSEKSKSNITEIIALHQEKKLTQNINIIISSYIHMNCNRLFRIKPREQEYILYDFLTRFYTKKIYRR
ncbi:thiopeptide-type bacteriocin biosynthesis protein [Flavobacterium hydrophilum]|uniref:Thiopeptide-type bacteriocin biosynthesis domain-containing protein n=1 Tax=Flavobacterium hydrophilum TaxID=2211445 RepID=A0A2V4BW73_9FLAO|nr:thiopeptide-type bacteriocin biosynthesis protein [Flavobacterium hydrophilum]PXY43249.1 hypothetical protein DMB68_21455 [Flavobacterium hydrophilum]